MAARAIWKGRIHFGKVDIPVKLYAAVEDRTVQFRLLDEKRLEPVKQRMVDPRSGDVVDPEDIRRAFRTEDGKYVILEEEDFAALEPEPAREIEIIRFVPPEEITHPWYDRPYYLGPDSNDSAYFALAEALNEQEKEGVARWVMRKKEYVGALRADGPYLMLITLRHAGEVVPVSALEAPGGRDLDKRELAMAKQLIAVMEDELDIAAYKDEYRDRVMELVEAKAAGKIVKFPTAPRRKKEKDLGEVLERSIEQLSKGRRSA